MWLYQAILLDALEFGDLRSVGEECSWRSTAGISKRKFFLIFCGDLLPCNNDFTFPPAPETLTGRSPDS